MFSIRADVEKNRLYITIGILESHGEILNLLTEIEDILPQLSPGFTCVTDLRQYRRVGDSGEEVILQVQRCLKRAGIVRAIRIERRQALPEHVQFETGSLEAGYPTDLVRSPEEAENLLAALEEQA
ncbi:hypothetical protein [Desulfobotulus sp.]|jgi:hypothetical protein|uniref:hypothetical protein n=1 Tax=Desulfobotulus sp. TaxID=1940337 RepID=UPI002A35F1AE|nr:hypothetical protein [Desulfobotulus sp.]MDY0162712.1 hypothetical protein [Desulfobotulus sp.]MDY0164775.1 hypothetical protein [Desulfobotulus sp.]